MMAKKGFRSYAKEIKGKEQLRENGYRVFDLKDFELDDDAESQSH